MEDSLIQNVAASAPISGEIKLSCQGLSSANWKCSDDSFEVVFGDSKVSRVHSILAEFLSPKISRVRKCDPCVDSFTITSECPEELSDAFEVIVSSLGAGRPIQVESSNFAKLLRLACILENSELISSLIALVKLESLKVEDAMLLLMDGIAVGALSSGVFERLRASVASRFYEIDSETLAKIDLETAQLLLSSPSLRIESEDVLYEFVASRSEEDPKFLSLFEFIFFEYLSINCVEKFAVFASENLLESMNTGIWARICGRLVLEMKLARQNPRIAVKEALSSNKPSTGGGFGGAAAPSQPSSANKPTPAVALFGGGGSHPQSGGGGSLFSAPPSQHSGAPRPTGGLFFGSGRGTGFGGW